MSFHASGRHDRYAARAAAIALSALIAGGGATAQAASDTGESPAAHEGATTKLAKPMLVPHSAALASGVPARVPEKAAPSSNAAKAAQKELRQGKSGAQVKALQQRLMKLGYWLDGADGEFGALTTQAVYALQKAAGIGRDGIVGPATWKALDQGVRPKATTKSGRAIEIDLKRQLLLVVDGGKVKQIISTSTGSGKAYTQGGKKHTATTPKGTYRVFRGVDAWDPGPLGKLYRPKYFNGGIAVHGYPEVPPYPASHGCTRVSLAAMDYLWKGGRLSYNMKVVVR